MKKPEGSSFTKANLSSSFFGGGSDSIFLVYIAVLQRTEVVIVASAQSD
jgi:hypothetical protein